MEYTYKILNAAFDATGIRFHDRAVALAVLKEGGREVAYDDDGQPYAYYDGETLPLADAITRLGYDRRDLVDARTLPREGAGKARPGTDHKGNYPTLADKVNYIRENGGDAWARLPTFGVETAEVRYKDDWYKLPTAEKVRRLKADPNALNKLPQRPTDQPVGGYINHALLEKERRTRPGSR